MDPLLNPHHTKRSIREATLEEVRLSLLRDARRPDVSPKTAEHYRNLAALISVQKKSA